MHKILVIDDDTRLRNLLGKFLSDNNFSVDLAKDALEAKTILEHKNYDILVVDVMMPGLSGIDFTKEFRKTKQTPILMLTAMGDIEDRIEGLEAGADDYLAKPFEPKELLLRINNILRRSQPENRDNLQSSTSDSTTCTFGDFTFNYNDLRLKKGQNYLHITNGEANILNILCQNLGKKISRDELSKFCGDIDHRSIDVQVTRLRKKLESNPKEPVFLQTIRGFGYILQK